MSSYGSLATFRSSTAVVALAAVGVGIRAWGAPIQALEGPAETDSASGATIMMGT